MKFENPKKYFVIFVSLLMISSGFGLLMSLPAVTGIDEPGPEKKTVQRVTLAEDFTGWNCGPCTAHNVGWSAAIYAVGLDVVAPIYEHVWWPVAPNDPFYMECIPAMQARCAMYSVPWVPWATIDGVNTATGSGQAAYEAQFLAAAAIPSDVLITSTGVLDDVLNTGSIDIHVEAVETIPAGNYRFFVMLWESNVTNIDIGSQGTNGETLWDWAVWDVPTTGDGIPLWAAGASIGAFENYHFDFDLDMPWPYEVDQIGATVFVQEVSGPWPVLQAHVQQFDFINTLPNVTLLDNNGQGEDGTWASTQSVTWIAEDPDEPDGDLDVIVSYSPNNGGNWYVIENGVDNNDGVCPWDTTGDADGTEYLLRVSVTDSVPFSMPVMDYSDAVFTIDNTPTIDLTTPDGGEIWMGGSSELIVWDMDDFYDPINQLSVELTYSTDGGGTFPNAIASGLTGFGGNPCSYLWDPIPTHDNNQIQVRAEVTDTDGITASDDSLADFEIDSTAPAPATNVRAELTATHVTIYWDPSPSPDVDHYEIYYILNNWDSTGDTYGFLVDAGLATSYQHINAGVNNPSSYCWQVRTFDVAGHETRTIIQAGKTGSMQSIFLNPSGWFMLGSHLQQSDTSLAHVIQGAGLPADMDMVQLYDAVNDDWVSNIVGAPSSINDLTDITNEQGFWLHLTGSTRWSTAGHVEDMTIPLEAGWNLVPYPFAEKTTSSANIMAHLSANCPSYLGMEIADYTAGYRLKVPGGTEILAHGSGFWVQVGVDTTWTVLNY